MHKLKKLRNLVWNKKYLFFIPFLFSLSFLSNSNSLRAGLEFQWDDNPNYKKLKYFQKEVEVRRRNTIFFFFRPSDRKTGLLKINLKVPKTFKSKIKEEKVSLCEVIIGGWESRTKCVQTIPSDIEISSDNSSIDIFPFSPLPSNKKSYAVVLKVFNPRRGGLYQFHSYGQASGKIPVTTYLGSWTLNIE